MKFRIVLAFAICITQAISDAGAEAFDVSAWQTSLDNRSSSRLPLFQKFLKEHGLIGKSRTDITNILGPGINENGLLKYQLSLTDCDASSRVVSIKFSSDDKAEAWSIGTLAPTQIAPLWNYTDEEKLPKKSGYKLLFPTSGESSSSLNR